jgi:uracil-DNA glycosylase
MITKPSKCVGCPFYQHGQYFTPDHIVQGSKVLFIAQNPGPDEEAGRLLIKRHYHGYGEYTADYQQVQPQPLIGATGLDFTNKYLPLSGLTRADVSVANAIRCRPGASLNMRSDDLPPITTKMKLEHSDADIVKALKHCRDAYLQIPDSTQLIVTMGRHAMFSLTGIQNEESEYGKRQGVMESWRGYAASLHNVNHYSTINTSVYDGLTSGIPILFTMHIAALYKGDNKRFMHATLQDFYKVKRLLAKQWPQPLPTWSTTPPAAWPHYAAFDTEYIPDTNELTRWSLCDTDYNLYCVESFDSRIPVRSGSTVLIQNALADIRYLANIIDISQVNIEDMMLAHSVLWTGEPHNLNYIASMYGAFNRYKHLSSDSPQLYSALDAYEPMHMWRTHFIPEFKADPTSWKVYKQYRLPLINIINKAQLTGAKVNTSRLTEVQRILQQRLQEYQQQARQLTGDDKFNVGGRKKMMEQIYG